MDQNRLTDFSVSRFHFQGTITIVSVQADFDTVKVGNIHISKIYSDGHYKNQKLKLGVKKKN